MQLSIRKSNLQWSDALAHYAERRVHNGLDRVRERVRRVFVRFVDVNGPRGGDDKHCAVSVRLASGEEILVSARDACPYRAVDGAVNRLKRSVTERTKRNRRRRRRTQPSRAYSQ